VLPKPSLRLSHRVSDSDVEAFLLVAEKVLEQLQISNELTSVPSTLDVSRHASRGVAEGRVSSQDPAPRTRLDQGSRITVNVSTGPPPVTVPDVAGDSSGTAQQRLAAAGLTASTTAKSSAKPAGTVLSQSPGASEEVPRGSQAHLTVAAPKSWQKVTSFTADGEGSSDIFRVRGGRWRITYTLTFGKCGFGDCFPPQIYVHNKSGTDFKNFSLKEGTHTTSVPMPPGPYYVEVTSGSQDDFAVAITVEEYV
jgi:PASTA domain